MKMRTHLRRARASSLLVVSCLLCVFINSACAKPPSDIAGLSDDTQSHIRAEALRLFTLSIDDFVDQTIRVHRIADRIRIAGEPLCGSRIGPVLGVALLDVNDLHYTLRRLAIDRFGKPDRLHVVAVFPGGAAERAGVRVGDAILTLNGTRLNNMTRFSKVRIDRSSRFSRVEIFRDGRFLDLEVPNELGCRIPVTISRGDERNASTDFQRISIASGMLRIFDDDRIAFVIGHEIGHTIVRQVRNFTQGGRRTESAADYFGLYLVARAGFKLIDDDIWEQLQRDLKSLDQRRGASHPSTHKRNLALRAVIAELRRKIDEGVPLMPESK